MPKFNKKTHTKDSPADHNYANDLETRIGNAIDPMSDSNDLSQKIFRFYHDSVDGVTYPVPSPSGAPTNIFRNWKIGAQPIAGLFEIHTSGYAIKYIGKEPLTVDVQISTSAVFSTDGWLRFGCWLNDSVAQLIRIFMIRRAGLFENLTHNLTIYLKEGDTIWFKTEGEVGTFNACSYTTLSIIPR